MFVLDVIPFSRSGIIGSLTYRSRENLQPGTLVEVSLRRARVRGIVVGSSGVLEAKALLKSASFLLRSSDVVQVGILAPELVTTAQAVAEYHATQLGSVLATLFAETLPKNLASDMSPGSGFRTEHVEAPLARRFIEYHKIIEQGARESRTTLLVAPTLAEVERYSRLFREYKPTVLSGAKNGARREAAIEEACAAPTLVITTPSFSFVPITHMHALIVERPSAGTYQLQKRPALDMLVALRLLAQARGTTLALGDYPLPLEYRAEPSQGLPESSLGTIAILDSKKKEDEKDTSAWQAVPAPMLQALAATLEAGGRAAVLAVRRGYAPAVVCRDCGTTVRDAQGRGLSLSIEGGVRVLRSADGTSIRGASMLCDLCGSWNLLPLGVGIERVVEELAEAFPETPLIRFDTDTIKTPTAARKAIEALQEPGTLTVGTEFLLPWLPTDKQLDLATVPSADSLLALPFWKARERLVRIGLTLRERALHTLINTRRADDLAFAALAEPSSADFFTEETGLRKALGYPPFSTLISFEAQGAPERLEAAFAAIAKAATPHTLTILPDRLLRGGQAKRSGVMRLSQGTWPDAELVRAFRTLPPAIRIRIDPESF